MNLSPKELIVIGSIILLPSGLLLIYRLMNGLDGMYMNGFGSMEIFYLPVYITPVIIGIVLLGKGIERLYKSR